MNLQVEAIKLRLESIYVCCHSLGESRGDKKVSCRAIAILYARLRHRPRHRHKSTPHHVVVIRVTRLSNICLMASTLGISSSTSLILSSFWLFCLPHLVDHLDTRGSRLYHLCWLDASDYRRYYLFCDFIFLQRWRLSQKRMYRNQTP